MTAVLDARRSMVEQQIRARGVADQRVLDAMRTLPRERFVPSRIADLAYEDAPLQIEEGQTISQPYVVALMLEAARIQPTDRVLEIGAGSGYVAALLSKLAKDVHAVEWHAALAILAKTRLELLGCANAHVMHGDGTLGWPDRAPFDAIIVSAGGPEVPSALLSQLAPNGRLVIPVGAEPKSQELLLIVRTGDHEYERSSLGHVHFVPLVGTEGWASDGTSVPSRRMRRPIRLGDREASELSKAITDACEPFSSVAKASLDGIVARIGSARVVLIGEATHGTSEFYALRARITQALVSRAGFNVVALEADWPDTSMIDRIVRRKDGPPLREPMFSRFPTWMWRNSEMQRFTEWMLRFNDSVRTEAEQCAIYGLDVYSLNNSIGAVLDDLERVDPSAAARARELYSCFSPWERDPAVYGRAAVGGLLPTCEKEALSALRALLEERLEYCRRDGDRFFDAARNATVVAEAEKYYRAMYRGARESWNLRDRHMFETLLALLEQVGYRRHLERDYEDDPAEAETRWACVEEVATALDEHARARPAADDLGSTIRGFLDDFVLQVEERDRFDRDERPAAALRLMTLHAAKGLEFDCVWMVGLEEGLLPHHRAVADGLQAIDEERRLCYVGVTRARRRLVLSLCLTRTKWGKPKPSRPSRFLYELTGQAEKFSEEPPQPQAAPPRGPRRRGR